MTKIQDISPVKKYIGNGVTTQFPFTFMYWDNDEIIVQLAGVKQTSGYTITTDDKTRGGTVVFTTAPANGVKVTIRREIEVKRYSEFEESGLFRASVANDELNRIVAEIQQAKEILERCVKVDLNDDETPEELLAEVYQKLDSATAIAADARTAADNATTAANMARQAATEATEAAEQAVTDITTTANDAVSTISNTSESAITTINTAVSEATQQIEQTSGNAVTTINNTVTTASATINQYVDDAEEEVRQIARTEAQSAIANAAQEVTQTATNNINSHVENNVKPVLQSYVTAANTAKTAAETAATTATTKASEASTSASNALGSETRTRASETAVNAALAEALELTGYAEIFGGTCGDNIDDEIIGGLIH